MVVGQQNKIALIIQARMKSTRLPGKVLLNLPLGNGKPLLSWITDELKMLSMNKDIYVATSKNPENDKLEKFCQLNQIRCFRGDENDVLSRFISIVKLQSYDCVVRLTADNPIIDISILEEVIHFHLENRNEYTATEGLPVGMNFEVVDPAILLRLEREELTLADREHVTLYIKNKESFKKGIYELKFLTGLSDLRLTVDYISDYTLISTLLTKYQEVNSLKGIKLVLKIMDDFPWIFDANMENFQKAQFKTVNEELKAAFDFLVKHDFNEAAKIIKINER